MQSAASKRALSTLASKIHPQFPLSPRESQQLLTLLTTSFRAHLDREFPHVQHADKPMGASARRASSPVRSATSHAAASRHIDSILTNPLFAVKPKRRNSEPAAVDVLRDPKAWFENQIASGTATLQKAVTCMELLYASPDTPARHQNKKSLATVLAQWLRTNGTDTSSEFVKFLTLRGYRNNGFLDKLLPVLIAEGQASVPWRWFIKSHEQRLRETNLDAQSVVHFRQCVLHQMVYAQSKEDINAGLATFLQGYRMAEIEGHDQAYAVLAPAGAHIVNRITNMTDHHIQTESYQIFLHSSQRWLGKWSRAVEAMLWLHHPTQQSALPGLDFIKDSAGAVTYVKSKSGRRNFLVQLCLGVSRQLLEGEKYADAQVVMEFTKTHFPDLVLSTIPPQKEAVRDKKRKEKENLELLDQLIPA